MNFLNTKYMAMTKELLPKGSYNGFKAVEVKRKLDESFKKRDLMSALFWSVEYHLSGKLGDWLSFLFNWIYMNIVILNTDLLYQLHSFIEWYLKQDFGNTRSLDVLNNQKIRNFIGFIIPIIFFMPRNKIAKLPKILDNQLVLSNIREKIRAPNLDLIGRFMKPGDPKELIIPLNEIMFTLLQKYNDSMSRCQFWLSWVLTIEKKYFKKFIAGFPRHISSSIGTKFQSNWVWLLIEIIQYLSKKILISEYQQEIMLYLLRLYIQNWTLASRGNKVRLLEWMFYLLSNADDLEIIMIPPDIMRTAYNTSLSINLVYHDVINQSPIRKTF